jgi:hypothetical protein
MKMLIGLEMLRITEYDSGKLQCVILRKKESGSLRVYKIYAQSTFKYFYKEAEYHTKLEKNYLQNLDIYRIASSF